MNIVVISTAPPKKIKPQKKKNSFLQAALSTTRCEKGSCLLSYAEVDVLIASFPGMYSCFTIVNFHAEWDKMFSDFESSFIAQTRLFAVFSDQNWKERKRKKESLFNCQTPFLIKERLLLLVCTLNEMQKSLLVEGKCLPYVSSIYLMFIRLLASGCLSDELDVITFFRDPVSEESLSLIRSQDLQRVFPILLDPDPVALFPQDQS